VAKEGGPSRDWLDARQAYVASAQAKRKIRQYFGTLDEAELLTRGRNAVTREMQRDGHAHINLEALASRLGFKDTDAFYVAVARGEPGSRALQSAMREMVAATGAAEAESDGKPEIVVSRSRAGNTSGKVLIVGMGDLLTSLSRCCKPAPPDAIKGFVTRGRGVSIHRVDCRDFRHLAEQHPERVTVAEWGERAYDKNQSTFSVDILVQAMDRQGLLRDISELLLREKLNLTAVNTQSKKNMANMRFTLEVGSIAQLQRALVQIREVKGVLEARRG
jgi:GTP pyrophosphokinase